MENQPVKTGLLRIHDDHVLKKSNGGGLVLLLLKLSSSFDAVD